MTRRRSHNLIKAELGYENKSLIDSKWKINLGLGRIKGLVSPHSFLRNYSFFHPGNRLLWSKCDQGSLIWDS